MKIIKTADYNEMSRKAANLIGAQVIMKPNCILGLATGSSPIGTYKELIKRCEEGDLDFSQLKSEILMNTKDFQETMIKAIITS